MCWTTSALPKPSSEIKPSSTEFTKRNEMVQLVVFVRRKALRHRLNAFALTGADQPRNLKRTRPTPGLMAQPIQEWLQPALKLVFPIRRRVPLGRAHQTDKSAKVALVPIA